MTSRTGGGWLAAAALAWLGGVALQLQQPALWPRTAYGASACAALALLALRRPLATVAAAAALAFGAAGWHAALRLDDAIAPQLEGRDLLLTGVVDAMPRLLPDGTRFVFAVEDARLDGAAVAVPRLVSLGWYHGWSDDDALLAGPPPALRAGERWRFTVRLKAPHGEMNPHGFDRELSLFEDGIGAVGHVRSTPGALAQRLDADAGRRIERWRQDVRDAILVAVSDPRAAGVIAALAVGDQAAIERADWDLFRATGIAHLMSISGLHVTMFAWLAAAAIGVGWRRSARLVLALPAPLAARWGGVAAAAGYAVFAGWGVPAQRTVWMLATWAALASVGVRWPWPLVLATAAVVVTAIDPWAMLQPGFWLSFVAVGVLLASEPAREPRPVGRRERASAALRGALRTQAVASVGLAPLSMLFFQQVSVVGFAANLVAIPFVTLLVTPLALLGVVAAPLWRAAQAALDVLGGVLAWFASWPGATWTAAAAPTWAQIAGLAGGALCALPLPWRLKGVGVALLLPLVWPAVQRPEAGRFELVAADIGQGSAVLLRTREHWLVYDAGPQYSRDSDAGQRVLLPLLRALGASRIDTLVLSHRDSDHIGGAAALVAGMPVVRLLGSLDEAHPLRAAGVPFEACAAGSSWSWDGVRFTVLHPAAFDAAAKPNAMSCVLRVEDAAGASALLSGDIGAAQEASLVAAPGRALKSDLLLVPHHGSRTSSSDAFVAAVAPRVAIVQAGYRNRYGHPAPEVIGRYARRGVEIVDSVPCGAWTWRDGAGVCERDLRRRYWHHAGSASRRLFEGARD